MASSLDPEAGTKQTGLDALNPKDGPADKHNKLDQVTEKVVTMEPEEVATSDPSEIAASQAVIPTDKGANMGENPLFQEAGLDPKDDPADKHDKLDQVTEKVVTMEPEEVATSDPSFEGAASAASRAVIPPDVETNTCEDPLLQDLNKLDEQKLPSELQSLGVEKLSQAYCEAKSISVLMTGKTGSGKSTLVNGILGVNIKVAEEGNDTEVCTKEVDTYKTTKNNIDITVWDSPGLQAGTVKHNEYLQQMKLKSSGRDLTIYCIRISEIRFVRGDNNPDMLAMKKLTETFGNEFWKTTIIVLTFANTLEAFNLDWEDLPEEKKQRAFKAKILCWKEQIQEVLIQDVKVPKVIVDTIQIVPAGHHRKPHLPGYEYWLSNLWFHSGRTVSTFEARSALVRMNAKRLKGEDEVTGDDYKKQPEHQPIVVGKKLIGMLKSLYQLSGKIVAKRNIAAVAGFVAVVWQLQESPTHTES